MSLVIIEIQRERSSTLHPSTRRNLKRDDIARKDVGKQDSRAQPIGVKLVGSSGERFGSTYGN